MAGKDMSAIRNKIKRRTVYRSAKLEKTKAKLDKRKEQAQAEKLDPKLKEVLNPTHSILICRND
jgi:hypothetical protein